MVNLVNVENSQVVTTSLKVAEIFGKNHSHVLRSIKQLECSEDFRASNFGLSKFTYSNGNIKKQLPMYYITRDGFMFLVMGFTGKTAAKWKEAYIRAFNEMEAKLRAEQTERAIKAAVESERIEDAEYKKQLEREEREEAEVDRRVEEYARQRAEEAKAEAQARANAAKQGDGEAVRIDATRCGWSVVSSKEIARLTGRPHSDVMKSMQKCAKYCKRSGRVFIRAERWEADKYGCRSMMWSTYNGVKLMHKFGRTAITDDEMAVISHAFRYHTRHLPPSLPLPFEEAKQTEQQPKKRKWRTKTEPRETAQAQHPAPTKPQAPQAQTVATMPQTPTDLMQRFVKAMGVMMGVDTNEMFNLMQKGE